MTASISDTSWNETFHAWVNKVVDEHDLTIDDVLEQCANHFEILPSLARGWYNKKTNPHPMAEPLIINWLINYLESGAPEVTI